MLLFKRSGRSLCCGDDPLPRDWDDPVILRGSFQSCSLSSYPPVYTNVCETSSSWRVNETRGAVCTESGTCFWQRRGDVMRTALERGTKMIESTPRFPINRASCRYPIQDGYLPRKKNPMYKVSLSTWSNFQKCPRARTFRPVIMVIVNPLWAAILKYFLEVFYIFLFCLRSCKR